MKSYKIFYFHENVYTPCHLRADSLEEAIQVFEKTFEVDGEEIPEHYRVFELVYSK